MFEECILKYCKSYEEVGDKIYNAIKNKEKIVINLRDINSISSHNRCLLVENALMEFSLEEFGKYVRFKNVNRIMRPLLTMTVDNILDRKRNKKLK